MIASQLTIEYEPVGAIKPSAHNARTHSKAQIRKLADLISRFGMCTALGVDDDNVLIYGHARLEAAKLLGMITVPVVRLSHLSPADRRAVMLADNRVALDAGWDQELLAIEFDELAALDFSLPALGFSLPEIDHILDSAAEADARRKDAADDVVPPQGTAAVTCLGDIWQLDRHRLLCADARDPRSFSALLSGEEVGLIFTDPPYNVKIDGNVGGLGKIRHREFVMGSGEMPPEIYQHLLTTSLSNAAMGCRDGTIAFVCMDWRHMGELLEAGKIAFTELKNMCVWNKKVAGMGTFYRSKHEMIFVFKVGTASHINNFGLGDGGRYRTNVWDYAGISGGGRDRLEQLAMHPTVKPVELIADALRDCSQRGDIVLDCFGGSGTTLIAAHKTGRTARLIEYDPLYCDTIVRRFTAYTGKQVRLVGDGRTFEEIAEARGVPFA